MTKAELIEKLSDLDDDIVICSYNSDYDLYYEVNSIEAYSQEINYMDSNDKPNKGKIVVL